MNKRNSRKTVGEISTRQKLLYVEWKIDRFLSLFQEVDDCIRSPSFQFSDAKWHLCVYPNGETEFDTAGCIVLLLVKEDSATPIHRVSYHIGINKCDSTIYKSWRGEEDFRKGKGWGVFPLMKRSILHDQESNLVPKGTVTFFCYLQVKSDEPDVTQSEGVRRLITDFKNLMRSGEDSDLTIKVKSKEFKVHRAILRARSFAFLSTHNSNNADNISGMINIDDCEPETFEHYLTHVYTGCINNLSNDIVCELYITGNKYDEQEIKEKCTEFMTKNLTIETFCDVLTISLQYNEPTLLRTVTDFFIGNTRDVITTPQWHNFLAAYPEAANELYSKALECKNTSK